MTRCYVCRAGLRLTQGKGRFAYWYSLGRVEVPETVGTLVCTGCKESWVDPSNPEAFRTGMRAVYGDPAKAIWDPAKVLRRALVRIRQGWVKEHLAIDEHGVVVLPRDATAVCWSLLGAVGEGATLSPSESRSEKVAREICEGILRRRVQRFGGWRRVNLHEWNDDRQRTQKDVVTLLTEAIEEADDRAFVPGEDDWTT